MAVFIAICDDSPADRKQFERLLSREKDARLKNDEVIYFDTYGSEEALLPYCMKYDMFLIDISFCTRDGMMVAADLKNHGAEGLMVLCASSVDYEAKYGPSDDVIYMKKPLYQRDFTVLTDRACSFSSHRTPRLELRGETDTLYVKPDEIIYAKSMTYYTLIALTGDRSFHIIGEIERLSSMLYDYDDFLEIRSGTIINMKHIVSKSGLSLRMSNGAVIKFNIFEKNRISRFYGEYVRNFISD